MIKLLCFPYAGGSSNVYSKWKKYFADSIQMYPIEFAGRGKRFNESFYNNFDDAIDDLYNTAKDIVNGTDFALFGHSMGSLIAYEIAQRFMNLDEQYPAHIFFSGANPPHFRDESLSIYKLSDEDFKKEIYNIGGTPEQILYDENLYKIFAPIIRADYKVLDSYNYNEKSEKLNCNISVLVGEDDKFITSNEWEKYTRKECKTYNFPGDHFYINNEFMSIIDIINSTLERK